MHSSAHCNTIHSSQDLEAAWMFVDRWMDKGDAVYIYNGYCCCCSVAKSCLFLCNPMDYSTPGFPVLQSAGVCSNSCPLSWCCYLAISSSATSFFCLQYFPASGSMEYYSAIKRNNIGLFVEMWMNLESVIQSEVSQKDTNTVCVCVCVCVCVSHSVVSDSLHFHGL